MIKSRESQCCGCAACAEVCPVQAIQMKTEKNGFYYPVIDSEICIKCNKCLSVCRFSNDFSFPNLINQPVRISYIARLKNIDNLLHSASGGMFTAFSDAIIQENGVIYGALFDDEFRVYHGRAEDPNERDKMRGSKYVQSNTVTIYKRILNDLKSNRKVVFFGTPCQCSAILGFLSSCSMSTDKLILVDIICHGVSSPLVWKKYLNFVKEKYINEDISNVCFRDKYYGYGYNMTIKGNTKIYHKDDILDPYIYIFTKNLAIRPSCYECPFKKSDRVSDITIGDFQKARLYFPEFDDGKGNSVVLINTKKGKQHRK